MEIKRVFERDEQLISSLVTVWESSIRATHDFFSETNIREIKKYVFQAIEEIPILVVAVDNKETLAFMGIAEDELEMLFITAQRRGQGIGRNLLEIGINDYEITEVCVNEQNPQAIGFYEHEGFRVYKRTETDEQGNPVRISPDQPVSMNMWGIPASFLDELEKGFPRFLDSLKEGDVKSEYLLPRIIDDLVQSGRARVTVLDTPDKWFGVTYKEDKQAVVDAVRKLIDAGVYKEKLYD